LTNPPKPGSLPNAPPEPIVAHGPTHRNTDAVIASCHAMSPNGQSTGTSDAVLWAIAGLFVALTSAKLLIIGNLDLFYDEATYWQASSRLDAGYTHTLMMTPLLIRAGTTLFGDTVFGVRILHLLCAAALPFAVYLLAHPMVGRRDGVLAAGVTLIMPVTALAGQAYMDPAMFLFTVLGLAAFERARRNDSLLAWLSLGAAVALGVSTHYRFAPLVLGLLAYLLMTRRGQCLWKKSGLWIAGLVGALGLVPVVYFNLKTGFAGFTYQVMERNPWTFQTKGLMFPLEQILLVTPFLFIALMATPIGDHQRRLSRLLSGLGAVFRSQTRAHALAGGRLSAALRSAAGRAPRIRP
jgi:4-amino-4-deoxy-L-arabinose transferase-like glycosyltransferase